MTTYPPAPSDDGRIRPLDLAQPKPLGPLITAAWRLWRARPGVFMSASFVVAFVPLAILGSLQYLWDESIGVEAAADVFVNPGTKYWIVIGVATLLQVTLITWLITATHVRAVLAFASGEDVDRDEALRRGVGLMPAIAGATLLLMGAVLVLMVAAAGVVYLAIDLNSAASVPAVFAAIALFLVAAYIGVLGTFTSVVPAVGDQRGLAAIKESARLVRAVGFWLTLGNVIVIQIVASAVMLLPVMVVEAFAYAFIESDSVTVGALVGGIGSAAIQAGVMSWTALGFTLLYFSHRARHGEPWQPPAGGQPLELGVSAAKVHQAGERWGQPTQSGDQPQRSPDAPTNPIFTKPGQQWGAPTGGNDVPPKDEPPHFTPPER